MRTKTLRFSAVAGVVAMSASILSVVQPGVASASPRLAQATDPGITATTITVGNVATLTGPIPGLFQGGPAGTKAYFAYINSKGGINGRKIEVKVGDDALSCATNTNVTQQLIPQVFAFVGSFTDFDNCGATVFDKNTTVADIHYALQSQANAEPNNFSPQPQPAGFRTGPYKYYKQLFPKAVLKVGSLWAADSPTTWINQRAAEESVGYKIVYQRSTTPTESQFTSDIIRMRDLGVQFLDLRDQAVNVIADVLNQAAQQNWHPRMILTNSEYTSQFWQLLTNKANANNVYTDQQFPMFLGEDSKTTPVVALFLKWMKQTSPSIPPDLFAVYGWASAELFVQALKNAGKNPTRASLMAALHKIHKFNSNGMVATADPASKKPPQCWMLMRPENGKFVRIRPAKKGFSCSPNGYFYKKS